MRLCLNLIYSDQVTGSAPTSSLRASGHSGKKESPAAKGVEKYFCRPLCTLATVAGAPSMPAGAPSPARSLLRLFFRVQASRSSTSRSSSPARARRRQARVVAEYFRPGLLECQIPSPFLPGMNRWAASVVSAGHTVSSPKESSRRIHHRRLLSTAVCECLACGQRTVNYVCRFGTREQALCTAKLLRIFFQ
jgi:hypothetical protein